MLFSSRNAHKVFALVTAVVITVLLQGSLLAGFHQMASEPQCAGTAQQA